jgi:tetratricopeptide (TPR) repeat protein
MTLGRGVRQRAVMGLVLGVGGACGQGWAQAAPALPQAAPQGELRHGRELLMGKQFGAAKAVFRQYLRVHPGDVQAELGEGDAQLGLHEYEAAEATYRAVTAQQPQQWQAHKNLVVVEAALGRWEEFDRERVVLRMARQRGAQGISARESDVIDSFNVRGEHWVVRAYFEPVGRSEARYNFERFSTDGRVAAYLSLEDASAAQAALAPQDERIGGKEAKEASGAANSQVASLSLNWYTGTAHGTIRSYASGEPSYERLRADVLRWLLRQPEIAGTGPEHGTRPPK